VFDYAVGVDVNGLISLPGHSPIDLPEEWTPDHLLLAALVKCSIESLCYHAKRAGHEVRAGGSAAGKVTRRESDGRFAFVEIDCRIDAVLSPPAPNPGELFADAERDCFVGATLTVKPRYQWRVG
jgi:organic hydroperoxide reductase OsmC/OhrA